MKRPRTMRSPGCPTPAKVGYERKADGKMSLRRLESQGGVRKQGDRSCRVYRCECGLFHIGNADPGQPRTVRMETCEATRANGMPCANLGLPYELRGHRVFLCGGHKKALDARVAEKAAA